MYVYVYIYIYIYIYVHTHTHVNTYLHMLYKLLRGAHQRHRVHGVVVAEEHRPDQELHVHACIINIVVRNMIYVLSVYICSLSLSLSFSLSLSPYVYMFMYTYIYIYI